LQIVLDRSINPATASEALDAAANRAFCYFRKARRVRRLQAAVRAFLAAITFLTLTMTVMHRDDSDGYQAAHLFFMPRRAWEMDRGVGMLYEAEHYAGIDMEVLADEVYGPDGYERIQARALQPDVTQTTAYRAWLADEEQAYTAWFEREHRPYEVWLQQGATTFDDWLSTKPPQYRQAFDEEQHRAASTTIGVDDETELEREEEGKAWRGGTVRRAPHSPNLTGNEIPVDTYVFLLQPGYWHANDLAVAQAFPTAWLAEIPTPPPRSQNSL
jgi:hypothetical protein